MNRASNIDELHGDEGGQWRVLTQGGSYLIDLDKQTVTRGRSVDRAATLGEYQQPLIDLGRCRVGEIGFWQLVSNDPGHELFWHRTPTPIRHIERLPAVDSTL